MKLTIKDFVKKIIGIFYFFCSLLHNIDRLEKSRYKELYYMSYFSKNYFLKAKKKIIMQNENRLKHKKNINIGFVTYSASMWMLDPIYKKLLKNDKYNVELIIARFQMPSKEAIEKTYIQTKEYFSNVLNYQYITPDSKDFCVDKYDILFYCTPFDFYDKCLNVRDIKQKTLICYSCYSYMLAEKLEKLDLPIYLLSWKLFCDSAFYKKLIETKSRIYTNNAFYCGFVKMDKFYFFSNRHKKKQKFIIYAPHHSLSNDRIRFSTFDKNYRIILELVDKYKEVKWVIKPHPLLKAQCIRVGLFHNEAEYDDYLGDWMKRPNAEVNENGEYIDLFLQSDGIITDSVSFMAEYQFTKKPFLLLKSGYEKYNDFGNKIAKILYSCAGDDIKSIERYVNNIIDDIDPMKNKRIDFFERELNYYKMTGMTATDFIYKQITSIE